MDGAPFDSNWDHYLPLVANGSGSIKLSLTPKTSTSYHNTKLWPVGIPSSLDFQRIADLQNSARYLQRLDTEDCLMKYSNRILTGRQDVLAVIRRERYLSPNSGLTYTGFQNGSLIHVARVTPTSRRSQA